MSIRPFEYIPPADYKLLLETLREDGFNERPLRGFQEIANWFFKMKFTSRPVSADTLRRWKRMYGMPIMRIPRSGRGCNTSRKDSIFTTNQMLQAWMFTEGRALTLPRWHPFRKSVEKKALSQRPSAIRMRKRRDKERTASAYAEAAARRHALQHTKAFEDDKDPGSTDTA